MRNKYNLEYPSSELRGLAQVAVRLDLIDCAGWDERVDVIGNDPLNDGLGSFIQGYSSFGSSPLLSFSTSS